MSFVLALNSCGKWLDIQPYDKISEDQLYSSAEGFEELLNGIYIELNHSSLYGSTLLVEAIEIMGGAYEIGDEANIWGNYSDLKDYDYNTEYWRSRFSLTWNKAYSLILNCNKLLENIDSKKSLFSGKDYEIIKGEALALRAMLHFDMLRLFGPVYSETPDALSIPYYDTVSLNPLPQLPASEIITRVIKDLVAAQSLLINDPIITEGTLMSSSPAGDDFVRYRALRLNYYAVEALLARAHLYSGDKEQANKYALDVIKVAAKYFPFVQREQVIGTDQPDRIFSGEILFALSNSSRHQLFLNWFSPSRTTFTFKMETALINNEVFGGGAQTGGFQDDYRNRAMWSSSGTNRFFYKYSDPDESSVRSTMVPLIRIGEMYLIAAETEPGSAGLSYINTLRRNRGLSSALTTLSTKTLALEYIRELYGEGQLFYFYKRLNTTIIRSSSENRNIPPSASVFVVPLPDTEKDN